MWMDVKLCRLSKFRKPVVLLAHDDLILVTLTKDIILLSLPIVVLDPWR
jgi:hypothetical protein